MAAVNARCLEGVEISAHSTAAAFDEMLPK
jgi:hypothetical protein